MNKTDKKLLELTYPTIPIDSLIEIVENTPNPTVATEILCSLYVEPDFSGHQKVISNKVEATFKLYDKWRDEVRYTYQSKITKSGYFSKDTKKEDLTLENFETLRVKTGSTTGCEYFSIETGEFETRETSMSLKNWLSCPTT